MAKVSEWTKKYQITLDAINEIVVVYPTFTYANSEKSKVLMMIGDWDQSLDASLKILSNEPTNIFALKAVAFHKLAREGSLIEACEKLDELLRQVEAQEDKNINLIMHISQLFSRVSGRNPKILNITLGLLQRGRKI